MVNGNGGPSAPPRPGQKPPMKKSTKNWLILGTVGGAGIIIWYVMRSRSSASTGAATTSTDPSIDPSTGVPYAEEYGGYGVGGGGAYQYGYYDPSTGAYITGTGSNQVVTSPTTNASWAQQVESYLQTLGYDPMHTAAAIGKYLTGQKLTADQMSIVQAALGFYGQPPQGAPPPTQLPPHGQKPPPSPVPKGYKDLRVPQAETLKQFAAAQHWSDRTLALVEKLNHLTDRSRLKKGQKILRPEWN